MYELIGELAREHGTTTVVVSHDPASGAIADRVVRVRDGRVSEEAARGEREETLVVGRGGWVRLPEELRAQARISTRVRARMEGRAIMLSSSGDGASVDAEPVDLRERRPGRVVAELRGVEKAFGERQVFARLDAEFRSGLLTVVTGRSGSGKSTLLRLLAGLEAGCGRGDGPWDRSSPSWTGRKGEAPPLARGLRRAGSRSPPVPDRAGERRARSRVAWRSIRERADRGGAGAVRGRHGRPSEHHVARLSAGERARVAVARAIAPRPALLADEATARLDQENAVAIAGLLVRLADELETAVVCATHDPLVIEQADEEVALGRRDVARRRAEQAEPRGSAPPT